LKAKIKEWLEKEGFPLEMRAARAFRHTGFEVRQSDIYSDPESGNSREIDVIAALRSEIGFTEVDFFVECKSSKHPWVILCAEDVLTGFNRVSAFSLMSMKAREHCTNEYSSLSQKINWLNKSNKSGYGLRKALNEADAGYAASMSAVKACNARLSKNGPSASPRAFTFTFPTIVVDTPIFECILTAEGELQLEQVERSEFLFTATIPNNVATCVNVIHINALPGYAKECYEVANALLDASKPWECLEL
jgi:hypothetical protein